MTDPLNIIGFVIAGGKSSRMRGADKSFVALAGRPLLTHVLDRFADQVSRIVLNSNAPAESLAGFGVPVLGDRSHAGEGPLAGLLSCLEFAATSSPETEWIATVPSDCPFLPINLVSRLVTGTVGHDACIAASGGEVHPIAGIWHRDLHMPLREAFEVQRLRSVKGWLDRIDASTVEFPALPYDPFFNVNTPEDLVKAEAIAHNISR